MRKFLKNFGAAFFALCYMLAVSACGMSSADKGGGYGAYGDGYMGSSDATTEGCEAEGTDSEGEEDNAVNKKPAGLMTAGAWNDNDYYQDWLALFMQDELKTGKFLNYSSEAKSWGFHSLNRVKVTVQDDGKPVAGAHVVAKDAQGVTLFEGVSDASGVAYLFTDAETGFVSVAGGVGEVRSTTAQFTAENRNLTLNATTYEPKKDVIELMFVIDATGSMGDEMSYLRNEVADVINRVAETYSTAKINLGLLFYRDTGDKEMYRWYDFEDVTTADGLIKQQAALAAQAASGGGDYPEAVDEALALAMEKQWSEGATTKILFHVLDAPPHSQDMHQKKLNAAVLAAAKKGVRVCPILCSGADILTEYVMRQAAVYTGGTFIFVTDDSGIGNSHHDPQLPNVTVEALNSLMVRLINGYHSGEFADPVHWRDEGKEENKEDNKDTPTDDKNEGGNTETGGTTPEIGGESGTGSGTESNEA